MFRPVILIGSALVAALVWRWRGAQILVACVLGVGIWHGTGFAHNSGPSLQADVTLYQKNMLFLPRDRDALVEDIVGSGADVVTLQEVSHANLPTLDRLRDVYPHQLVCNAHSVGAVAVLSRTALVQETCAKAPGMAMTLTDVRGVEVRVISVHLHWPYPFSQQRHARSLLGDISTDWDGATVIGGDFNMVASGRSLAWFEATTNTNRVGPLERTFDLYGYPLGIDHVLATGGRGALDVRPQLGSDHYGLLAWIDLP